MSNLLISPDALYLAGVGGLVITPVASWIKKIKWPTSVKFLVAVALSLAFGAITTLTVNKVSSVHDFLALSAVTLASSQAVFHLYFSGSNFDGYLTAIGNGIARATPVADAAAAIASNTGQPSVATVIDTAVKDAGQVAQIIPGEVTTK